MTAKPYKPSLIYNPIWQFPNSHLLQDVNTCDVTWAKRGFISQISLRNTVSNKVKRISILQSLWYTNVPTNLQDVIISVYQSYLTMKFFDLQKYLRANGPWNLLWPPHPSQSLCFHDDEASDQISLFLPLSHLLSHPGNIFCLVSHALTTISLPLPKISKYI